MERKLFIVGEPVLRKDDPQQRFYVPVSRVESLEGAESQIVLRVASDAFLSEQEAVMFGAFVEKCLNIGKKILVDEADHDQL